MTRSVGDQLGLLTLREDKFRWEKGRNVSDARQRHAECFFSTFTDTVAESLQQQLENVPCCGAGYSVTAVRYCCVKNKHTYCKILNASSCCCWMLMMMWMWVVMVVVMVWWL